MSRAAVLFDGVWKKFRRGERHDSLRDLIPSALRRLTPARRRDSLEGQEFWALSDVSFEVRSGEALGIIGPNGAGKSTTLKLLSRILKPTRGRCEVRGRVGALIEVAAGFHPDLTGRENIYLQGAIMGMKRAEIARRFDEILEFAGVGEFIDTPVKRYSTGMSARLGFSIAAHLNPGVLLIDEVLAVGDVAFQQKCHARMRTFRDQGVAIVFVSHNLPMVFQLCQRTLLLDHGRVVRLGPTDDVVPTYGARGADSRGVRGDGAILTASLSTPGARNRPAVSAGERVHVRVEAGFTAAAEHVSIGIVVWDLARNIYVYGASSDAVGIPLLQARPGRRAVFEFTFDAHLSRGTYAIEVNAFDVDRQRHLAVAMPAAQFTVIEHTSYSGVANLYLVGRQLQEPPSGSESVAAPAIATGAKA